MRIRRKLASFLAKSAAEKTLVCEAILMLTLARMIVITAPFRVLATWVSHVPDTGASNPELLRSVRNAVTTAARNVPWNSVCLPQAIAAKAMLARRGQGSAFHLGACLDENGKLNAHAWLTVGDTIVVGANGMTGMAPLVRLG